MKILLNVIWFICGGAATCIEYVISSVVLMMTIIGIPFGLQSIKLAMLMVWPFGRTVRNVPSDTGSGCLNMLMNVIWFFIGGIWIWLTHIFFGLILCITIIGIPFGLQHFKLAGLALAPFGKEVV